MGNFFNESLLRRRLMETMSPGEFSQVPDFVPPPEQSPAMSEYRRLLESQPRIEDYKPSKFRQVMAAIAGGGQGAVRGGPAGVEAGTAVKFAPFQGEMSAYKQSLERATRGVELEEAIKRGEREAALSGARVGRLGTQSEADIAKRAESEAQRKKVEKETGALPGSYEEHISGQERIRRASARGATPGGPYVLEMQDGSKLQGAMFDKGTGEFTVGGKAIPRGSIKNYRPSGESNEKNLQAFDTWYDTFQKEHGRPPTTKELEAQGSDPLMAMVRGMALQSAQMKISPDTVDYYVKQMEKTPDAYHKLPEETRMHVAQEWTRRTGLPPPGELTAGDRTQETKSRIAMEHVKNIREILKDPKIVERLGPIAGRLQKAEQYVGKDIPGVPPELQAKAQELRSRFRYLFIQEAQSLLGGRPAVTLSKMLQRTSPDVHMTLPLIMGSLDAIEGNSRLNLKSVDMQRFGGQYRREFDEGATPSGTVTYKGKNYPRVTKDRDGTEFIFNEKTGRYEEK